MWIRTLKMENFRSFVRPPQIEFSRGVNIIVGKNNSGKSSLLLPLFSLQDELPHLSLKDFRLGKDNGYAKINFSEPLDGTDPPKSVLTYKYQNDSIQSFIGETIVANQIQSPFAAAEPDNLIYPFLAKRKVVTLSENINSGAVKQVPPNFGNLNAKIDRASNTAYPANKFYRKACEDMGKRWVHGISQCEKLFSSS